MNGFQHFIARFKYFCQMSFASDKLWNGYLRQNMSTIVSKVKVREIVPYLQCLTTHDRENIEAKRETNGNYDAMIVLLECLKRRENWAEQFIEGLEACEQSTLAAEMRAEYRALTGRNSTDSGPVPSPTTVVRVHVHPAPSATQLPIPESGGNMQAAVAPPAETERAAQAQYSVETPSQQQAVQVPEAVPPPEPVPDPPVSTERAPLLPSTLPPSPEISHAQAAKAPQPQEIVCSHLEPEENSESNTQAVPGNTSLIQDEVNSGNKKVVSVVVPPQEHHLVSTSETGASPPDHFHSALTTNNKPPHGPNLDGSSVPTMTPEKQPVQDTTPLVNKVPTAVLLASKPAATQIFISSPLTGHEVTTSPDGMNASRVDEDYETVCLSKPNQLISFQPENPASPVQASSPHVQLYSGDTGRLEISQDSSDTVTPALSVQENGTTVNQNEPEENHYESPNQSMEEVLENVVCVSEVPSVSNLDGQTTVPHDEIISKSNSEPPIFTNAAVSRSNSPHSENSNPSEPKALQISEKMIAPYTPPCQSNNAKYFLVAAAVGVCALLMVWKFKK
ncbi:mitochondrial antiviral-signaling protein isoform X2 [Nematolebias whitei]|uniref:mitochondrial antiviral-signaling protein isoform X2 n=1 Tax=Nematolebias whitei TaxID=451745 RepID=UPI0018988B24|nr:mitochondrial antiviral-signaling protein isoform X2 [Nematolebias whitei]